MLLAVFYCALLYNNKVKGEYGILKELECNIL
jgi:hypothetical protein